MNKKDLVKKAYEDHAGVWPYSEKHYMVAATESNPCKEEFPYQKTYSSESVFTDSVNWQWVGSKEEFEGYGESLREHQYPFEEEVNFGSDIWDIDKVRIEVKFYDRALSDEEIKNMYKSCQDKEWVPEVGQECEVLIEDVWLKTKVIGSNYDGSYVFELEDKPKLKMFYDRSVSAGMFRPIKTEREEFLEKAKKLNRTLGIGATEDDMLNLFFDEGMRFKEDSQ